MNAIDYIIDTLKREIAPGSCRESMLLAETLARSDEQGRGQRYWQRRLTDKKTWLLIGKKTAAFSCSWVDGNRVICRTGERTPDRVLPLGSYDLKEASLERGTRRRFSASSLHRLDVIRDHVFVPSEAWIGQGDKYRPQPTRSFSRFNLRLWQSAGNDRSEFGSEPDPNIGGAFAPVEDALWLYSDVTGRPQDAYDRTGTVGSRASIRGGVFYGADLAAESEDAVLWSLDDIQSVIEYVDPDKGHSVMIGEHYSLLPTPAERESAMRTSLAALVAQFVERRAV